MDARAHKFLDETMQKVGEVFEVDKGTMWAVLEKFQSFDSLLIYLITCKYEGLKPKEGLGVVDSLPVGSFTLRKYMEDRPEVGGDVIRLQKRRAG